MACKDYLKAVGDGAERTYKKIVELKCTHIVSSASYAELCKNKSTTCNSAASISLQLGGCLPNGVRMGHVSTKGKTSGQIKSITDAMYGSNKLKHCRLIWINGYYGDLPEWLKRRGVVYIQWSNACVCAGDGYIWSCNQQGGYHDGKYTVYKHGVLDNKDTYPFGGRIFVAVLPEEKWYQHYAVEVILGMHGNGQDRMDSLGSAYNKVQGFVNDMCADYGYFLRWSADYLLEMYAGKDSASMKAVFGKHYDAVKKKASWVINEAQLCWQGKRPSGISRMAHYGKDYKIVQKQINRSVKGRSFNFSKL